MKVMKYRRSRAEILLDVLKAISSGCRAPTRIMYAANTSWAMNVKYLKMLMSEELIELVDNPRRDKRTPKIYKITKKGEQLLWDSTRAFQLLESLLIRKEVEEC